MRWKVGRNGTWIDLGNGTEIFVGDGHSTQRLVQSHNEGLEELETELKTYRQLKAAAETFRGRSGSGMETTS